MPENLNKYFVKEQMKKKHEFNVFYPIIYSSECSKHYSEIILPF